MADLTSQLAGVYYGVADDGHVTISFGQPGDTSEVTYKPMLYVEKTADSTAYPEWFQYVHIYILRLIILGDDPDNTSLNALGTYREDYTWVDNDSSFNQWEEVAELTKKDFKFLMDLWKWSTLNSSSKLGEANSETFLSDDGANLQKYLASKKYTSQIVTGFENEYGYAKIFLEYQATETKDYFGYGPLGQEGDERVKWIQKNIIAEDGSLASINPVLEDEMFSMAQYKKLVGQYAKLIVTGFDHNDLYEAYVKKDKVIRERLNNGY